MADETRFEVGDWVHAAENRSYIVQGAMRVKFAADYGCRCDDVGTWAGSPLRRATPEEVEAREIRVGDYVYPHDPQDQGSASYFLRAHKVRLIEGAVFYPEARAQEGDFEMNIGRTTPRYVKGWRHATPEEYRAATQSDSITIMTAHVSGTSGASTSVEVSDVPDTWNVAPTEESDLEDSHAEELTLDPLKVEEQLAYLRGRQEATSDAASRFAARLEALESTPPAPPAPELPPLLWDRITGEGPYINIDTDPDDGDEDGRGNYYEGNRVEGEASCQGRVALWPQTLSPKPPEPEEREPAEHLYSQLLAVQRAERVERSAHEAGFLTGRIAGESLGREKGREAGVAAAKLARRASLLGAALLGVALGVAGGLGMCYWQGHPPLGAHIVSEGSNGDGSTWVWAESPAEDPLEVTVVWSRDAVSGGSTWAWAESRVEVEVAPVRSSTTPVSGDCLDCLDTEATFEDMPGFLIWRHGHLWVPSQQRYINWHCEDLLK